MASTSKTQTKLCSSVSGKVRVVGRIRGFSYQELASDAARSSCTISVHKITDSGPYEKVKISFDDQTSSRKNEYEMDYCYGQNEDTALIFLKEIKPRISNLFDGERSTFIAFGARDSGKTYTIQGSEENLGLGMLAMDEILKIVDEGRHVVAVSIYEVFENHVYDLLDSKNPEVHVLEDAQGKVKLKGLSKVYVKSILEFQKLYYGGSFLNKPIQKIKLEFPRRSHKALMIHILACDEGGNSKCVGKMNFVDLAGYENGKRNSIDGNNLVESKNINKSLTALLNVIHAVNANEIRVPYRESIIARVLQDSLGGSNHISMLVCLNPLFCPDTIYAATFASRLKNIKPVAVSSVKKQTNSGIPFSANKARPNVAVCSTTKKQTYFRFPLSAKKTSVVLKGRKLFGSTEQASGVKEKVSSKELYLTTGPGTIEEPIVVESERAIRMTRVHRVVVEEEEESTIFDLSDDDGSNAIEDISEERKQKQSTKIDEDENEELKKRDEDVKELLKRLQNENEDLRKRLQDEEQLRLRVEDENVELKKRVQDEEELRMGIQGENEALQNKVEEEQKLRKILQEENKKLSCESKLIDGFVSEWDKLNIN